MLILPGWPICLGALELGSRNIVSGAMSVRQRTARDPSSSCRWRHFAVASSGLSYSRSSCHSHCPSGAKSGTPPAKSSPAFLARPRMVPRSATSPSRGLFNQTIPQWTTPSGTGLLPSRTVQHLQRAAKWRAIVTRPEQIPGGTKRCLAGTYFCWSRLLRTRLPSGIGQTGGPRTSSSWLSWQVQVMQSITL